MPSILMNFLRKLFVNLVILLTRSLLKTRRKMNKLAFNVDKIV